MAPSKRLRFVIQKHAARRLHYDFRLELDGVFKSWAVTRGPSLDPADKRLAVEVEDHPLDYGDFEGTIPAGQYGGGTVQIWDRGYWEPEGNLTPEEQIAKGDLKFTLDGTRLGGSWVLVRMRNDRDGGKRTNWLLIKHRDDAAQPGAGAEILEDDRSAASGRAMADIAQGKGRGPKPFMLATKGRAKADAVWHSNRGDHDAAGDSSSSRGPAKANGGGARAKASTAAASARESSARMAARARGVLRKRARSSGPPPPEFIAPQLAKLVEKPPQGDGWGHEIKIDGYRIQMRVANGKATLYTRKGLDWTEKFGTSRRRRARLRRLHHRR